MASQDLIHSGMLSRAETEFLRGEKQAKPQQLRYLKHCVRRKIIALRESDLPAIMTNEWARPLFQTAIGNNSGGAIDFNSASGQASRTEFYPSRTNNLRARGQVRIKASASGAAQQIVLEKSHSFSSVDTSNGLTVLEGIQAKGIGAVLHQDELYSAEILQDFEGFCHIDRQLSDRTARGHVWQIGRLLDALRKDPRTITRDDLRFYLAGFEGKAKVGHSLLNVLPTTQEYLEIKPIPDKFYESLVHNINESYRFGIYVATLILVRKLVENLLIDILRKKYTLKRLELFFDKSHGRFLGLSELISSFEGRSKDFKPIEPDLRDLVQRLRDLREEGNTATHSMQAEIGVRKEDLDKMREDTYYVASCLVRIYTNIP
jgi:hypothetical protein